MKVFSEDSGMIVNLDRCATISVDVDRTDELEEMASEMGRKNLSRNRRDELQEEIAHFTGYCVIACYGPVSGEEGDGFIAVPLMKGLKYNEADFLLDYLFEEMKTGTKLLDLRDARDDICDGAEEDMRFVEGMLGQMDIDELSQRRGSMPIYPFAISNKEDGEVDE